MAVLCQPAIARVPRLGRCPDRQRSAFAGGAAWIGDLPALQAQAFGHRGLQGVERDRELTCRSSRTGGLRCSLVPEACSAVDRIWSTAGWGGARALPRRGLAHVDPLSHLPCCLQTGAKSPFSFIIYGLLVEQNRRLLPPSYTGSLTTGTASHTGRDGEQVCLGLGAGC